MKKLVTAIIGMGVVGKRRKHFIEKNKNYELIAVSDITFKKDSKKNDIYYYKDYKSIKNHKLDCVFVTLPNYLAPVVTGELLKKNISVFCEKPPGRNINDIKRIIKIENKSKGKLMYGFNHRYHDSVVEALKIVQSNKLGEIINLRGVYGKSQLTTFNQADWRTKRDIAGGGVLLDQGIHMVDLMRLFTGEFEEVHSFISNNHWNYNVEDNAYALMRTTKGTVAMLNSSATQWRHMFRLDINLEKGSLILGGILSSSKSYGAETLTVVSANPQNDNGNPREVVTRYNTDPSWYAEIKEFAECILNNREISSGNSYDALQTMKLVFRIYFSDKKWRKSYNIKDPNIYE